VIATVGNEAIRVEAASQNVGIGLLGNPASSKLHVADVNSNGVTIEVSSNIADAPYLSFTRSRGGVLDGSQGDVQSGDQLGIIDFTGYGVGFPGLGARIEAIATENFGSTNNGTKLSFQTAENSFGPATERLVIDHNGNVGIGSSAPSERLQVDGNIALGNTSLTENAVTVFLNNSTGAASIKGTIVIVDAGVGAFNTTNSAGHSSAVGVVMENGVANGQPVKVAISGVVQALSDGSAIAGQHCVTSNTNGQAGSVPTPSAGTSIGLWLEDVASPGFTGYVLLR
jgi:hypothetical protein